MSSPESSSSKALVTASKCTSSAKSSSITPSKKHTEHPQSTPVKIAKKKVKVVAQGCGGSVTKIDEFNVCQSERDEHFIGGTCCYCMKACRKLFQHQCIAKILPCPKSMGEVKGQSLALRPKKAGKAAKRKTEDLLETVANTLGELKPRLDDILQRLQRLEEANAKKRRSK